MEPISKDTRDKAKNLFTFLRELSKLRSKVTYDIKDYEHVVWFYQIPREKECSCIAWNINLDTSEPWLEIRRPKRTNAPELPERLVNWVSRATLNNSTEEPKILESIVVNESDAGSEEHQNTAVIHLKDQPEINETWLDYLNGNWKIWAEADLRLCKVEQIYNELFTIFRKQQAQGELFEVVLGFGFLQWKKEGERSARRHILTTKTVISFDSKRAIFTLTAPANGSKIDLEQDMVEHDQQPSAKEWKAIEQQLNEVGEELWDRIQIPNILKSWIYSVSPNGRYNDTVEVMEAMEEVPSITYAPALILRKRNDRNLIRMYEDIICDIEICQQLPIGITRLVEIIDDKDTKETAEIAFKANSDIEPILFPLPSNPEQRAIAERLQTHQGVIVQGPPGTGKSHTIANLICHLLASGNRILVTSHTSRALSVLHEKLPKEMASLCVSILSEDLSGLKSLEDSVNGITNRFNRWNPTENAKTIADHETTLQNIRSEIVKNKHALKVIRESETYKYIDQFENYSGTLATISKKLAIESKDYGWLQDKISESESVPLEDREVAELEFLLKKHSGERSTKLHLKVPEISSIMPPLEFEKKCALEEQIMQEIEDLNLQVHSASFETVLKLEYKQIEIGIGLIETIIKQIKEVSRYRYQWTDKLLDDMFCDRDRVWKELELETKRQLNFIRSVPADIWNLSVSGLEGDIHTIHSKADDLLLHLNAGGNLGIGFFKSKVVRDANYIISTVKIEGRTCNSIETLTTLVYFLKAQKTVQQVRDLWSTTAKLPAFSGKQVIAAIKDYCEPIEKSSLALESVKLLRVLLSSVRCDEPNWINLESLQSLEMSFRMAKNNFLKIEISTSFNGVINSIAVGSEADCHPIVKDLISSVKSRNPEKYSKLYEDFRLIHINSIELDRIESLLKHLQTSAPKLAENLKNPNISTLPENWSSLLKKAWSWKQCSQWIQKLTDPAAQSNFTILLNSFIDRERIVIGQLASERAWRNCFSTMTESQRQHLMAWSIAIRKIGKGTGKHANKYRNNARESMEGCRTAIPAWIMPLLKVAETIKPGMEVFDVVIIDEASQSGPEALFLHYLAKKLIIVGDDKQISPENAGIERDAVQVLREKWISDIPHNSNFGLDDSFFDLGVIRFSGRVRLREHFRCMPEIIQFSNNLCYQSEPLIPLKQFGNSRLTPVLVAKYVEIGYQEGSTARVCNRPEADAIVEQIALMVKDPLYLNKTIGVISLLGGTQAQIIERKLVEKIGPEEMEKRELICGDAYTFQGDERDIIILSLVSSPSEGRSIGVLSKASDERRFNVAASRAREQMWLFHSVSANELNPKCLRNRLLDYFNNPTMQRSSIEGVDISQFLKQAKDADRWIQSAPAPFDSWFEIDVFLKIHARGYRVIPQYEIAGRRIDLVVETIYGRIAVECDGDHWHGSEHFQLDLARQIDLERCGFRFWRVRESVFYLNKDQAMSTLWEILGEPNRLNTEKPIYITNSSSNAFVTEKNEKYDVPEVRDRKVFESDHTSINIPIEEKDKDEDEDDDILSIDQINDQSENQNNKMHIKLSTNEIAKLLADIVASEGPMPTLRALRLYAKTMEMQRLTIGVKETLKKAISRAIKLGLLIATNEIGTRGWENKTIRTPNMPLAMVRPRGDRSIEEIAPSEFGEFMKKLRNSEMADSTQEEIYRATLRFYGFERLTSAVRKQLDIGWNAIHSTQIGL